MKRHLECWMRGAGSTLACLALLLGCASGKPYQLDLMAAPEVYEEGVIDPFIGARDQIEGAESILFATDRDPVTEGDGSTRFYASRRGKVLRLGRGMVELGDEEITWQEARRVSLLKNRSARYPLRVSEVHEYGVLEESVSLLEDQSLKTPEPGRLFAEQIARDFERSGVRDVYIYVHGYKVNFENPLLVATELWHFMGYRGSFIAFSWPATPSALAYTGDIETAAHSALSLRSLVEFVSETTEAERIHILGYSAGTRVVAAAVHQLALIHGGSEEGPPSRDLRLGNVILVGSDIDPDIFGNYLLDGLVDLPEALTLYMSEHDQALGVSSWIFKRGRIGQTFDIDEMSPALIELLRATDQLRVIDVTDAQGSTQGNGHSYFRSSPWVSSDVLMTMLHDLSPAERGLVRDEGSPLWRFPADYIARLRAVLSRIHPGLSQVDD